MSKTEVSLPFNVILDSIGNPDHDEDPTRRLPGVDRRIVPVADFAAASKACRDYIEENNLGAGNWAGGKIHSEGKVVAEVSYNGKVWPPGGYKQGVELLWPKEPSLSA